MAFLQVGNQAGLGRLPPEQFAGELGRGRAVEAPEAQDAAETFLASLGHNASSGTVHPTAPAAQSEDNVT